MAICRFWQQGNCNRGNNCKFEHPGNRDYHSETSRRDQYQSGDTHNRPDRRTNNRYEQNFQGSSRERDVDHREEQRLRHFNVNDLPWKLSKDIIRDDLVNDKPGWPLSCYGPTRTIPVQLMEGAEIEQSPEEIRMLYYVARSQGRESAAAQNEFDLAERATKQVQSILQDLNGACKYIWDGQHVHPNRIDILNTSNQAPNPFDADTQRPPAANPFAQVREIEATKVNPFTKPTVANPFAQNQQSPSTFARPPDGLTQGSSPFAQAAQQQHSNPFARTETAPSSNPFLKSTSSAETNVFGAPAQAQSSHLAMTDSTGFSSQTPNPFGQPVQQPNPFMQPQRVAADGFGNSTPSSIAAAPNSKPLQYQGMGFQKQIPQSSNPLSPPQAQTAASIPNPFAAPPPQSNGARTSSGAQATSGSARRSVRKPGAPPFFSGDVIPCANGNQTEAAEDEYGAVGSEKRNEIEAIYRKAKAAGEFDGKIPEVAPLQSWVDFNF